MSWDYNLVFKTGGLFIILKENPSKSSKYPSVALIYTWFNPKSFLVGVPVNIRSLELSFIHSGGLLIKE